MFNVGIDYEFLDHRLYGSIEYYNKTSKDLLYLFPMPTSHGIADVMQNLAKVQNNGFEFEIGADIFRTNDFLWSLNFNIASSTDKILDLAGNDDVVMSDTKRYGRSVTASMNFICLHGWESILIPVIRSGRRVTV